MTYSVIFSRASRRQLRALPQSVQTRIRARIDALAEDPVPIGAERLAGSQVFLRLRVGDYRIIYEVQHDVLVVYVVKVGHRKDVYRGLEDLD